MAVFRVEKNKSYTVMSNHHLRNRTLSLKAKGLLSQMLSLPEDWDYTLAGLASINKESKDAIRTAVRELEEAGYVVRRQTTDARGKFSANEYIIHECPQVEVSQEQLPEPTPEDCQETPPQSSPLLDHPLSENPSTGNPSPENPTQLNTKGLNTDELSTDPTNYPSYPIPSYPSRRERSRTKRKTSY